MLNITGQPETTIITFQKGPVASELIEHKIGTSFNLYYPPILVILGTIGNTFSFFIYRQKKYKQRSSSYFIWCLALFDSLMLFVGLLQYWALFNFAPKVLTEAHCKGKELFS